MSDHATKEEAMKYMLLIHQGATPLPGSPAWDALADDQKNAVYGAYKALNETAGVTPGLQMQPPETATTVRVHDGQTLTTDGPFVETKEALGGYLFLEADDLDAAIALAAKIPAASMGGAIEVRPVVES
jgi:hypothetical protein